MAGLLMLGKIANVQFADKPDGWDTLVFEVDKFDRRLNRSIPTVQTALIPNDSKEHVKEFRAAEGNLALVPVELRSSKNGGAYLIVTGGIVDATTLLTAQ